LEHALTSKLDVKLKENRDESNTGENYIDEAGMIQKGLKATEDEENNSERWIPTEKSPHKEESVVVEDTQNKLEIS
jgi:hypothetical protein